VRPGLRQQRPDVLAIHHAVARRFRAGELGKGRKQIHRGRQFLADAAGGNFARPAENGRHAKAAFISGEFPSAQRSVAAAAFFRPLAGGRSSVIGREQDERPVVEA
jgi:hypothetical protein